MLIDDLWGFVYHDFCGMLISSNYANVSSLFISLMYDMLIFKKIFIYQINLCFLMTHRICRCERKTR